VGKGRSYWQLVTKDNDFGISHGSSTDANRVITFNNSGNVGIGTTRPNHKLDINGMSAPSSGLSVLGIDGGASSGVATANIFMRSYVGKGRSYWQLVTKDNDFGISHGSSTDANRVITFNNSGNVGIGTTSPSVKLDVNGNARITGNLRVDGIIDIGIIDVSQITGLLGEGFTLNFPDILNNLVTLEISGIIDTEVVMISGMGLEIERIPGFSGGNPSDQPGFSMEYPIIFETTSQPDADAIINWFTSFPGATKSGSVIIKDLAGVETSRWNFFEYTMATNKPGVDGRTRFTLVHTLIPNNVLGWVWDGVNGSELSFNPATDKLVEIAGEGPPFFYPQVELDEVNRTITLTYDYNEGGDLYNWVKETIQGIGAKRSSSIIETTNGDPTTEISRINYFECFPIKFEQFYGFGLNTKLKTRIVISYDYWQVGT